MQWPLKRMARSQPKVVVQDDLSAMPKSMSTSSLGTSTPFLIDKSTSWCAN